MYNTVLYLCVLIVFSLHRESLKLILATDPLPRWFCHRYGRWNCPSRHGGMVQRWFFQGSPMARSVARAFFYLAIPLYATPSSTPPSPLWLQLRRHPSVPLTAFSNLRRTPAPLTAHGSGGVLATLLQRRAAPNILYLRSGSTPS
jgi:hypothetical protein